MPTLLNAIFFQMTWVASVGGAAQGYWWAGLVALTLFAVWQFRVTQWPRADFALMCLACLLGLVIDSAFIQMGLLRFTDPVPFAELAPIWILGMWMGFALTLNHSLRWFRRRLLLGAVFGLIGGPLAYYVAEKQFEAVRFIGEPWIVLATLGLTWAVATPVLLKLSEQLVDRLDQDQRRPA
mgnify:CR=1 FL=1